MKQTRPQKNLVVTSNNGGNVKIAPASRMSTAMRGILGRVSTNINQPPILAENRMSTISMESRQSHVMKAFPPPQEDRRSVISELPPEGPERIAAMKRAKAEYDQNEAAQQMLLAGVVTPLDPEKVVLLNEKEDKERTNLAQTKAEVEGLRKQIDKKSKKLSFIKLFIILLLISLIGLSIFFAVT